MLQSRPVDRILVVGGSYGGIAAILTLLALQDGTKPKSGPFADDLTSAALKGALQITLVDERDGFFHTVGSPLAHVARSYIEPFWKTFDNMKQLQRPEIDIVQAAVTNIDPEARAATIESPKTGCSTIPYDYLILASGLQRAWPAIPTALNKAQYMEDATRHVDSIESSSSKPIVVIGGGAVGVEFAAEIKASHPRHEVLLIHSRPELLSAEPLPPAFKARALHELQAAGVDVVLHERATVSHGPDGAPAVTLGGSGRVVAAGAVVLAVARWAPNSRMLPAAALDAEGYVCVHADLSLAVPVENAAVHFAIGDVVAWPGIRRAGRALAMGRIAAVNVFTALLEREEGGAARARVEFPSSSPVMGLAVGQSAVAYNKNAGLRWGPEQREALFQSDLGWAKTLAYLGLE